MSATAAQAPKTARSVRPKPTQTVTWFRLISKCEPLDGVVRPEDSAARHRAGLKALQKIATLKDAYFGPEARLVLLVNEDPEFENRFLKVYVRKVTRSTPEIINENELTSSWFCCVDG